MNTIKKENNIHIKILAEKFYQYSLVVRGYSPDTVRRYRNIINFYCKFADLITINHATKDNAKALFFHGRMERQWKPATVAGYYMSLTVFFRSCMMEGYISKNPVKGIEIPKKEKSLPCKLSREQASRLMEVVYNYPYEFEFLRHRNHAIFSTFIFAGLRKKELLSLRLMDIDISNQSIFIRQGKARKDRVVPMSATLAQSLQRYIEERRKARKTCPEFFCSLHRNVGYTAMGLRMLVDTLRKILKVKFTIHQLRHTFATLMLEGGCDIFSLSKMMGHNDIKTTTLYLSASVDHLKDQISKHPMND